MRVRNSLLRAQPLSVRLVAGIGLALVAAAVTEAAELPQHGSTFILILPAVFLAAYLGGRDAGIVATIVGALAASRLIWAQPSTAEVKAGSVILFVIIGVGTSLLLSALKRAWRDAEEARAAAILAEQESDLLLRELRHRIKNDIANIDALLRYQAKQVGPEASEHLDSAAARLTVLRRVHEKLTRSGSTPVVQIAPFLEGLCRDLEATMLAPRGITLDLEVDECTLSSAEALALGLITNELVTNAVKYAFDSSDSGKVSVSLQTGSELLLAVNDNGGGGCTAAPAGTGQRLIRGLCSQLKAKMETVSDHNGTRCSVRMPMQCEEVAQGS